jgi:hypothetical protein
MNIASHSNVARLQRAGVIAAIFMLTAFPASSSSMQISEEALEHCAALSNTVRRVTCFDLLVKLHVTEQVETSGRGQGVIVSLRPELMSELDAWIGDQPEPKPSRAEAVRQLLESVLRSQGNS